MSIKEKLLKKKQDLQEQYQRGKERTEQMKAEKLRKKANKLSNMKPGARKAITEGMMAKKSVMQVMKDEYARRKYDRESKDTSRKNR